MKRLIFSILLAPMLSFPSVAGEIPALSPGSLAVIAGDDWTGGLTYLNYGEPVKDFTIPAELDVEIVENGLKLAYIYPEEPQQNSIVTAKVSADGTKLMGAKITANRLLESGAREIVTTYACQDMGQTATCEMIYQLSETEFSVRKMVTYAGASETFRRNAYSFTR